MTIKRPDRRRKYLTRAGILVCICVFVYAAYILAAKGFAYYENRKLLNDVKKTFYHHSSDSSTTDETKSDQLVRVHPGFEKLLKQNQDIVGWIRIDDTVIDYPIVQSSNNDYYLTHNFNKETSIAGSIFMDYRNTINSANKNTIIYGHRMKDGSMFKQLTKFKEKDFYKEHQTFTYETLHETYEAQVFAVYDTMTDFNYIQTEFENGQAFKQLLTKIQSKSLYHPTIELSKDDSILTLSTCDYDLDKENGRLVVQAKLVKKSSH